MHVFNDPGEARPIDTPPLVATKRISLTLFALTLDERCAGCITHARFLALLGARSTRVLDIRYRPSNPHDLRLPRPADGGATQRSVEGAPLLLEVALRARLPALAPDTPARTGTRAPVRLVTFWGLGYSADLGRWLLDEWRWEPAPLSADRTRHFLARPPLRELSIALDLALARIEAHRTRCHVAAAAEQAQRNAVTEVPDGRI